MEVCFMALVRLCDICRDSQLVKTLYVFVGDMATYTSPPIGTPAESGRVQLDLCGDCAHHALNCVLSAFQQAQAEQSGRQLLERLQAHHKRKEARS
jgi:hypothetical protein